MRPYDPSKPIIGIHVPKCAGTSLTQVLKKWFGRRLYRHYFDEKRNKMPKQYRLQPIYARHRYKNGICIYGHFNKNRHFGIADYYPEVEQFFTIVREPFEIALSRYFFGKQSGEKRMRRGKPEKMLDLYTDINDFLGQAMARPFLMNHMPDEITAENYEQVLGTRFVYIGIAKDLQTSVDKLAAKLGFTPLKVGHLKSSVHNEEIDPESKRAFVQSHSLEYAIYDYAQRHYDQ